MQIKRMHDAGEAVADRYRIEFDTGDVYFMSSDANQANGCCIYGGSGGLYSSRINGAKKIPYAKLPEGTRKQITNLINRHNAELERLELEALEPYSPDPWRFDGHGINDRRGTRLFKHQSAEQYIDDESGTGRKMNPRYQNDSLIAAAAPSMFYALEQLVEICRYKLSPNDEAVYLSNGKTNHQALIEAVAALDRARGKEPGK